MGAVYAKQRECHITAICCQPVDNPQISSNPCEMGLLGFFKDPNRLGLGMLIAIKNKALID